MCGFLISISNKKIDPLLWSKAFNSIDHRGPDSSKVKLHYYNSLNIKFGFHRLAIVDHKNKDANQPFVTKKSILVFNGEIYNYLSLKKKLIDKNIKFKTKSDTEVLVRYLEIFGLSKTLNDLEGMWSFAWFVKNENKMFLSRDRYGEKPLYYFEGEDEFIISSEIKAILLLANKKFNVDNITANNFLNLGIINYNKSTFFSGISQIPPSYFSELNLNNNLNHHIYKYHKFRNKNNNELFKKNSSILKKKLIESFNSRLTDEVNIGFLVSGGIDSSINLAIAKKIIPKAKLNLFFAPSLDANNKDNKNIAYLENFYKLKINRISLPTNNKIIFKYLKKLIWVNDYPLTSPAAINQYLMGVEAKKKKIKVLISGQGADELFYGYLKYYSFYLINLFKNKKIFNLILNLFFLLKNNFFSQIKFYNILRYLNLSTFDKTKFLNKSLINIPDNFKNFNNLKKRSFDDMNKFSVPTLCHTEDRMYMVSGIETRFPFLNKNIQDFALSLPDNFKLTYGYTKYILRNAFIGELPDKVLFRKDKEGFDTGKDHFFKQNKTYIKKNILHKNSLIFKEGYLSLEFIKYFDKYLNSSITKNVYDLNFIFRVITFEIWLVVFKKYLNSKNI